MRVDVSFKHCGYERIGYGVRVRRMLVASIGLSLFLLMGSLVNAQPKLNAMGGPGGNYFEHTCGPGRVLLGIAGYAGVWIDNVQAICARVDVRGFTAPQNEGPVFGGNRPLTVTSYCQQYATVVAGLSADENKDNRFLGYIAVRCQNLSRQLLPEAPALKGSGRLASEPSSASGSELFVRPARQECPTGTVAVGILGRSGQFVDALGLICGPKPRVPEISNFVGQEFSFQSLNYPDRYIRHRNSLGFIEPPLDVLGKNDATFKLVPGLAGRCLSFQSHNYPDHYLRHQGFRLILSRQSDDLLFKEDATFCVVQGQGSGFSFESFNYPSRYIRHRNNELWVDSFDSTDLFRKDSTFHFRPPLSSML